MKVGSGLRGGGLRRWLLLLAIIVAFGVLVPWYRGIDFFDAFVIFSYSAIALLVAGASMADLMASGDATDVVPGGIIVCAVKAWLLFAVIIALGIASVNLAFHAPMFLHPTWRLTAAVLCFALCGSLLISALAALLAIVFTPAASRNTIRVLFFLCLVILLYVPRLLPPMWRAAIDAQMTTAGLTRIAWTASAAALLLAAGLIFTMHRGLPRSQPQS